MASHRITAPREVHILPQDLGMCSVMGKKEKEVCRRNSGCESADFKIRRLSWILQVDPM